VNFCLPAHKINFILAGCILMRHILCVCIYIYIYIHVYLSNIPAITTEICCCCCCYFILSVRNMALWANLRWNTTSSFTYFFSKVPSIPQRIHCSTVVHSCGVSLLLSIYNLYNDNWVLIKMNWNINLKLKIK
jgi:hypothetical protein